MGLTVDFNDGQTPLEEEEKEGLLIPTITTHSELDECEHRNIEEAIHWTMKHSFKPPDIVSEEFIRLLHKRMFGEVWSWAGTFRTTNKNIGKDKREIPIELKYLIDDARFWITNRIYSADELTLRFKHRLVSIHCFPNGNGRHSRLMADIIIENIFLQPVFTWGASQPPEQGDVRVNYLRAMKAADQGDFDLLLAFARS
jgi:Fic-DOC domain mobile mystery protein B